MKIEKIKELQNYTRLNAKNLEDIHKLMMEVNYELFGLIVNIPELEKGQFCLDKLYISHNAPVGISTIGISNRNKDIITHYPGWQLLNTRGTIRDKDSNKPTKEMINNINPKILKSFSWGRFDTIDIHSFQKGFNTGSFNGGYDFMGCFEFFIDDFPHIKNDLEYHFSKEDIMKVYGIKDWNMYLRRKKLERLSFKLRQPF